MMEKILGIGGLFFRSTNPENLVKWYQEYLGVEPVSNGYEKLPWKQEAGATAFAPFPEDTEYFGSTSKGWMLSFRVRNLDAMEAQRRAVGSEVKVDPDTYPNGRFARIYEPEGNPIEL